MNILTVNQLLSNDMSFIQHLNSYPPFLRQSISDHWDEIRSEHDFFNPNLATHFLRIRIGIGLQNYNEFSECQNQF